MNTGNQWGMAWYGAEGEAERESEIAEEDGVTKDRRENQRRRGGILDRNTGIKQEQVLMSINSTLVEYTNEEGDQGWHLDSPSP